MPDEETNVAHLYGVVVGVPQHMRNAYGEPIRYEILAHTVSDARKAALKQFLADVTTVNGVLSCTQLDFIDARRGA